MIIARSHTTPFAAEPDAQPPRHARLTAAAWVTIPSLVAGLAVGYLGLLLAIPVIFSMLLVATRNAKRALLWRLLETGRLKRQATAAEAGWF